MKIQDYKIGNKHGEIHKRGGVYYYQTKSGKTVREYSSVRELIRSESGQQNNQTQPEEQAEVVEETTE
jgi:hypothetical protein